MATYLPFGDDYKGLLLSPNHFVYHTGVRLYQLNHFGGYIFVYIVWHEDPAAAAEKTPAVLAHYRSYKPILAPYAEVDCDTTAVSVETMRETLQRLADAIDSFDLDAADAAMAELGTYEWREDLREWVERLRALVADVAMENVLKTVQTMMDMLSENGGEE